MLRLSELRAQRKFHAIMGRGPILPVPRDRLPAEYYLQRRLEEEVRANEGSREIDEQKRSYEPSNEPAYDLERPF